MVLPNPADPCRASLGRTKPSPNVYCRASPNHTCSRENSREGEPSVLPSAALAIAGHNSHLHAHPYPSQAQRTASEFQRTQQRGPKPSVLRLSAVTSPCPSKPHRASTEHAGPNCATSHHIWTYTSRMPAVNRPCLGRQSPRPTSLPASVAISSMSRRFNTSGSN